MEADVLKGTNWVNIITPSLEDGEHTIKIHSHISVLGLMEKEVIFNHHYVLDTIPPPLEISDAHEGMIFVKSKSFHLEGKTEKGAHYSLFINDEVEESGETTEGNLSFSLTLNEEVNRLELELSDKAGNKVSHVFWVRVDTEKPLIKEIYPSSDGVIREEEVVIGAKVVDKNSGLKEAYFTVDGETTQAVFRPGDKVEYPVPFRKSGEHEVKLLVKDRAGNERIKKWSFSLDTTKIIIDISERRLYLLKDGKLLKKYKVAVGMPGYPTPVGEWEVIGKVKNPVWRNPHKPWSKDMPEYIPGGPGNPLGPRAIYLSAPLIRIHGTPNISSVGRAASHGCIRMYPWDVIDLYTYVSLGTPVSIRW
jgi:lipoprotein-anchoring transpeptidase ErfK/SrfK